MKREEIKGNKYILYIYVYTCGNYNECWLRFILQQIVQEILSAPPSQCMPDDARADILSMTLRQLLYRGDGK